MNLLFANDRPGQHPDSWYAATTTLPEPRQPLRGRRKADVCIVGAGYTGLSAALHLAEKGLDVAVLEAHRAGFGASGRNGGQMGSGFNAGQKALEAKMRGDAARRLWDLGEEAKALTRRLIETHAPEARYRPGVVHAEWHARSRKGIEAEIAHMAEVYGYDRIDYLDRDALHAIVGSPVYACGVIDRGAGHMHPLRYVTGLARAAELAGATIYEGAPVHRVARGKPHTVATDRGHVTADHVILACNGYLGGLDRHVASRVMPINNFIAVTEPLPDPAAVLASDVAVADGRFVINYFRLTEDNRLLFGGGESYGYRFPRDIAATVRKPMEEVFPHLKGVSITHAWGGTLAITMSRLPFFARPAPGLWSASGYSGHGVALATLAGKVLAEGVAGVAGRFDLLSQMPTRPFPGGAAFRSPLLALAMTWYAMRDRIGI